jgi:acyl-CoA thioesterase-2
VSRTAENPAGEPPAEPLAGQAALDELVDLLDLETLEVDLYRGFSPPHSPPRVFGGQVAGQSLVAAGRTVPADRGVHSLHAYFIRPGDPRIPIIYRTERVRDGHSFTTRRVLALQRGEAIFSLSASFQLEQRGLTHTVPMPPGTPDPETVPVYDRRLFGENSWFATAPRPLDLRYVDDPVWSSNRGGPTEHPMRAWMRADGRLPDDRLLHVCLLTYASDMTLLSSVVARHDVNSRSVQMASLDHAMWFHQPFRADEWLLYDQSSPSASGGRSLTQGKIFTQSGEMAAAVMQEGLTRYKRDVTPAQQ